MSEDNAQANNHPIARRWCSFALAVLVVIVPSLILYLVSRQEEPDASLGNLNSDNVQCGPECLWIAANLLGVPTPRQVFRDVPVHPAHGAKLGDLKKAAADQGFIVDSGQFDWDSLREHRGCAVLWVNSNHFVLADLRGQSAADKDRIRIYDPAQRGTSSWWSRSALEEAWTGETLLINRAKETSDSNGPRLHIDSLWVDTGIEKSEAASFQVPIYNSGKKTLTLKIADTSCSCTSATVSTPEIEPGNSSFLDSTVNLHSVRGPFLEHVALETNDPRNAKIQVILCGTAYYSGNLLSIGKNYLGTQLSNTRIATSFYVHDPGDHSLLVTDAQIKTSQESEIELKEWNIQINRIDQGSAHIGKRGRFFVEEGDYVVEVEGVIPESSPAGIWRGHLLIRALNTPEPEYRSDLSLTVLSNYEISPTAIVLSQTTNIRELSLRNRSNIPIEVSRVEISGELPIKIEDQKDLPDGSVSITFRLSAEGSGEFREDEAKIALATGEQLAVPIIVMGKPPDEKAKDP